MKRWHLLLLSVIVIILLAGCSDRREPLQTDIIQTLRPDSGPLPTASTAPQPENTIASTSQVIETPAPEELGRGEQDIAAILSDVEVCGLILPISSGPSNPSDSPGQVDVSIDTFPEAVRPAIERIFSAPESVSLVAYEIGRESQGIYFNADIPMPLASVVKIINLVAYAEAVDEGILDPADWIPVDELNLAYLPGSDLGAHNRALNDLEERGLIGRSPPSIPLEELPWMMIRHSSNAASDYIQLTLGQDIIESTAVRLGLTLQTAPCPWIGQFLVISNTERTSGANRAFVEEMISDPDEYGREVMRLTQAYTEDDQFRKAQLSRRWRSDMNTQRLFSDNLNAQGSAREYADLMSLIIQNGLSSPYVNIITRRNLEWPTEFEANQEHFDVVGYKNGSLPGILTIIYYAQRRSDGAQIVVSLFFRDLPMQSYRSWRQSLPHDELARWLLMEPDAIQNLGQFLTNER